jgi:thiol-disulfide isomerase/thioredoxin
MSCSNEPELKNGKWRGVITLQQQQLPFDFEISKEKKGSIVVTLMNADDRLETDSVQLKGDSVVVPMHIFDNEIRAKIVDNKLEGVFIKKYAEDYKLPFTATFGNDARFDKIGVAKKMPARYKIHFADEPDSVYAVGILRSQGTKITGTILTTTGDHRFLEGIATNDSLFLSTFDGEHAYLYKAKIGADFSLSGFYYSGKSYNTRFSATPNDTIELPDANGITLLKPGVDKFTFSFPGIDGKTVSIEDPEYQNKVVVVQIMGSWCPNCMDETKFLAPWYQKNRNKGVEIIGISYEKKNDFDYAKARLLKLKDRLSIQYKIAFAGSSDKEEASKTLPINHLFAFPTTIFIDKKGKVRKIHTGFSGPGTGVYYEKFVEEFNETINSLLKE